jgi:polyisoprenyl-phosphate glycosyltransferase
MINPKINIIVPLYNEEQVYDKLIQRLTKIMDASSVSMSVIMIDDGSKDKTPLLMRATSMRDTRFQSIFLSRNFGHQLALSAGLSYADATDAVMVIDGDLQDPPELINDFYTKFLEGYDVVYAVRKKRKESLLKKGAYTIFYKLLRKISYIEIPLDSGDFSLMGRKVVDYLKSMPEESRFIRGMRSWVGFNQIGLEYDRNEREDGESKYSFGKLLKLALNGVFNFSEFPIKAISNVGILAIISSMIYLIYILYMRFFGDTVPQGFTTLVTLIIFFGGVNLVAIGIIGEYILRIFFQVKGRPIFIVKEVIKNKTTQHG